MVEPSFIVLKRLGAEYNSPEPIHVILAKEGSEERALRAARQGYRPPESSEEASFDVFETDQNSFLPASWLPRSRRSTRLIEKLLTRGMTTVSDLFDIHQGIRTGHNRAFVFRLEQLEEFPPPERQFFRPAVGTSTIHGGRIEKKEFVFFPYQPNGEVFESEDDIATGCRYITQGGFSREDGIERRAGITGIGGGC